MQNTNNKGYVPIDEEPIWLNNTTPVYKFLSPKDGKPVWI